MGIARGQIQVFHQGGKAQVNIDIALLLVGGQLFELVVVVQRGDFQFSAAATPAPAWATVARCNMARSNSR